MNDALGRCHIDALDGKAKRFGVFWGTDGVVGVLQTGAHFALDRAVARGCLGIGEDSLLLALDICHFNYPALSSNVPAYLGTL